MVTRSNLAFILVTRTTQRAIDESEMSYKGCSLFKTSDFLPACVRMRVAHAAVPPRRSHTTLWRMCSPLPQHLPLPHTYISEKLRKTCSLWALGEYVPDEIGSTVVKL